MQETKRDFMPLLAELWRVLVAGAVLGIAWMADNQSAVITAVAMTVVWIVNVLFDWRGIKIRRGPLTVFLYVISMALAVIFKQELLPPFPVLEGGDPAVIMSALVDFASALIALASVYVGAATGIYNTLMKKVFDKLYPRKPSPSWD